MNQATNTITVIDPRITELNDKVDKLTAAVNNLVGTQRPFLSKRELASRWGIHINTLHGRLKKYPDIPRPNAHGQFYLRDVIEYEQRRRS